MNFSEYNTKNFDHKLSKVLEAIQKSSIQIQSNIEEAALLDLHGHYNNTNFSGDQQKKLDVISNEIMIQELKNTNECSILLSEENDNAIIAANNGDYVVAFDPLDGSSNIECNCCIGTIFGIFMDDKEKTIEERILPSGANLFCAGYILYGPATELVFCVKGNGVQRFTLNKKMGEYIYSGTIKMESSGKKIYSINESNYENWYPDMKKYISQYKVKDTKYTHRYIGSMVADIHRTLLYGGMFAYPADNKNKDGKLRVLYECFPMSLILEEAGGKSIIGKFSCQRILEIKVNNIHQRTPILMGSLDEIDKYFVFTIQT
jgi:fructose-1,6-bisphosphatase I